MSLRHPEAGQGTLEWVIAFPALILLLGGALQFGLVFTAKSTLDYAAFRAVRAATLNHGDVGALRTGLAQGLAPLYPSGTGIAGYAQALARATTAADAPQTTEVTVLNPTPAVVQAWETSVNKDGRQVQEIPNSRLIFAAHTVQAGETLQAANLYKARIRFCYPLEVPFVNRVIQTLMTGPFAPQNAWETACYQSGGLPIAAVSTQLMQSALYPQDLQGANGNPAQNPVGGNGGNGSGGGAAPGTVCGGQSDYSPAVYNNPFPTQTAPLTTYVENGSARP